MPSHLIEVVKLLLMNLPVLQGLWKSFRRTRMSRDQSTLSFVLSWKGRMRATVGFMICWPRSCQSQGHLRLSLRLFSLLLCCIYFCIFFCPSSCTSEPLFLCA